IVRLRREVDPWMAGHWHTMLAATKGRREDARIQWLASSEMNVARVGQPFGLTYSASHWALWPFAPVDPARAESERKMIPALDMAQGGLRRFRTLGRLSALLGD